MTMTTLVTPPPPTRNALPQAQRIRLMRSTRKLGEIFGTDPHVLEDDAMSSASSSSMSSASTSSLTSLTHHSASSSVTSLSSDDEPSFSAPRSTSSKKSKTRTNHLQPLFLKLNVKAHHRKASLDSASPISPISPLSFDLKTPTQSTHGPSDQSSLRARLRGRRGSATSVSWDFGVSGGMGVLNHSHGRSASVVSTSPSIAAESEARLRRKRMAKLKRTLGENVPVELVFGAPSASSYTSKPKPPPVPAPSMTITTIKVRPTTPPKIKLPVSPPPRLPELDVVGEERLNPFGEPDLSPSDVLIIGPSNAASRPISTMTTASVYSQPSAGADGNTTFPDSSLVPTPTPSHPVVAPTSVPKVASTKPTRPPRAEPPHSTFDGSVTKIRRKARSLNFHQRPHPLSLRSPPPPMPSPFNDKSFLSFSPSTPVPPTPIAVARNPKVAVGTPGGNGGASLAGDVDDGQFTPRAGSHSLDLPSEYRRSHWDNMPATPDYHTASDDVLSYAIPAFGRRKEREWSGEWNKQDMTDVLKGLRGLKAH